MTVKAAVAFVKKHPAIAAYAAGMGSVLTGVAKGAVAQVEHDLSILQGCASGSAGACGEVWNQVGPGGPGYAILQTAGGIVAAGESVYHNVTHGQGWFAAGQASGYIAIYALTRGIGAGADAAGADAAGAAAGSSWLSRPAGPSSPRRRWIEWASDVPSPAWRNARRDRSGQGVLSAVQLGAGGRSSLADRPGFYGWGASGCCIAVGSCGTGGWNRTR